MNKYNFRVTSYPDYHDIGYYARKDEKYLELPCWPDRYGQYRYFAVYWKGRKPSCKAVLERVKRKAVFCDYVQDCETDEDVSLCKKFAKRDLRDSLKEIGNKFYDR